MNHTVQPALDAIRRGAPEAQVRTLLTETPDVKSPVDADGNTLLHYLTRQNYVRLAHWALDLGANPGVGNFRGKTPIDGCLNQPLKRRMFGIRGQLNRQATAANAQPPPSLDALHP